MLKFVYTNPQARLQRQHRRCMACLRALRLCVLQRCEAHPLTQPKSYRCATPRAPTSFGYLNVDGGALSSAAGQAHIDDSVACHGDGTTVAEHGAQQPVNLPHLGPRQRGRTVIGKTAPNWSLPGGSRQFLRRTHGIDRRSRAVCSSHTDVAVHPSVMYIWAVLPGEFAGGWAWPGCAEGSPWRSRG